MTTRKKKDSRRTVSKPAKRRSPARGARAVFLARDLMTRTPITVRADMRVGALCDLLQEKNINGAPVVDAEGRLVGVVTQEDIIYGSMGSPAPDGVPGPGRPGDQAAGGPSGGTRTSRRVVSVLRGRALHAAPPAPLRTGEKPFWAEHRSPDPMEMPVSTIMTSPAISAEEDTPVTDLCRIMWSLRIHRVPILRKSKVTGLVSSMDLCRAVIEGKIKI